MKTILIFCLFLLLGSLNARAVIYGADDRVDVFQSSDLLMKELVKSTAAQILNAQLRKEGSSYTLISQTLTDLGVCPSEIYSKQKSAAQCSGFLVAEDILVTAGRCIKSLNDCSQHSWVFDFANTTKEQTIFTFTKDQIFHCTQILALEKNSGSLDDYAVLKLDRPVLGRVPLRFRTQGKVAQEAVLTVLGHSTGLPLKIIPNATIRYNENPIFFATNADTSSSNVGSPVVDSKTGIVEGITVRGKADFIPSGPIEEPSCFIAYRDDPRDGNEHTTRITNIKVIKKK